MLQATAAPCIEDLVMCPELGHLCGFALGDNLDAKRKPTNQHMGYGVLSALFLGPNKGGCAF